MDHSEHAIGSRIALALASIYLIRGSTYLAIRYALEGGFPPFLLGGIRFLIAGGLMYGLLRWRGMAAPTRRQWHNAGVMGAPRAPGAGRQRCLRQSGDRGRAGRMAGGRALRPPRTAGDGRDPAGRGGDHLRQGSQADIPMRAAA